MGLGWAPKPFSSANENFLRGVIGPSSGTCEMDVCRESTTVRWRGQAGIPSQEGRKIISTEKWVCLTDMRRLSRAQNLELAISLTPDGWLWIDSTQIIIKGLDKS